MEWNYHSHKNVNQNTPLIWLELEFSARRANVGRLRSDSHPNSRLWLANDLQTTLARFAAKLACHHRAERRRICAAYLIELHHHHFSSFIIRSSKSQFGCRRLTNCEGRH